MPAKRSKEVVAETSQKPKRRPTISSEARETEMIGLAIDLAEQQLRDGTASSQVITHYLKLGTMRERREIEKLENENKLIQAKIDNLDSVKRIEELYSEAMEAMKAYRMSEDDDEEEL